MPEAVFEMSAAVCHLREHMLCEMATPLAYCCNCDRVIHLSQFISAVLFVNNNNTTLQLCYRKIRAAQVVVKFNY